ncbi:MAG: hypothetical protein FWG38_03675 [Defluviitaleaceae bacterium]|nr:hypothetical protein [Defluviitaleaceae bacterium]
MKEKMIDFLLANANPSIKRRVKSEILGDLSSREAATYQAQTMTEPIIQKMATHQRENGWIGHIWNGGVYTQGGAVHYLAEKAVDKDTPLLKRAMEAFATVPLDAPCYNDRGRVFDEFKYPGMGVNLVRTAYIAQAGYDDVLDISHHIQLSLDSFKRAAEVASVYDILHLMKKGGQTRYVFNDYEKWPCVIHLEILADTASWRNEANIKTVAKVIENMMKTDNPDMVSFLPGSQVGCFGGCLPVQGLTVMGSGVYPSPILCPVGADGKNHNGYYHFKLMETFARCGIVPHVLALQKVADEIADSIDGDGVCRLPNVAEDLFRTRDYYGLQLETDWRSKTRKACDITFRALLILHYSGAF